MPQHAAVCDNKHTPLRIQKYVIYSHTTLHRVRQMTQTQRCLDLSSYMFHAAGGLTTVSEDSKPCLSSASPTTNKISLTTLHYIIVINVFKENKLNHFTKVKRNQKYEFSVDVWKLLVMWQIWFLGGSFGNLEFWGTQLHQQIWQLGCVQLSDENSDSTVKLHTITLQCSLQVTTPLHSPSRSPRRCFDLDASILNKR